MAQKFGFPYGSLGGAKKAAPKPPAGDDGADGMDNGDGGDATSQIHEHLRNMHAATGHAHTHVEHNGDGTHTSHHIDEDGNISGPHDHANLEELKGAFDNFVDEEEKEPY